MKNIKYILLFVSAAAIMLGCKEFDPGGQFSDKDAFIGFINSTSGSVNESAGKATLSIALSSVSSRIGGTATIVVDKEASTAVAGINYVDPGTITLEFPGDGEAENNIQKFDIQLVQNGIYTGNTTIVLKIESVTGSASIGPWNTYTLTIMDADHPLSALSGTRTFSSASGWTASVTVTPTALDELTLEDFPVNIGNGVYEDLIVKVDLDAGTAEWKSKSFLTNFGTVVIGLISGGTLTDDDMPGTIVNGKDIHFTGQWGAMITESSVPANVGAVLFNQTTIIMAD